MCMASKAQMEIMGLTIVVILIAIGILFALRFSLSEDTSTLRQEVVESELGGKFLTALLSTTTDCSLQNPITVSELFQDCAVSQRILCSSGERSCEESADITIHLLNATLGTWGKSY